MPSSYGSGYRIPSEGIVSEAIMEIMSEATTVRSQTRFHKLVLSKLKDLAQCNVKLSALRLRRIAAKMDEVDLIIHCRQGKRRFQRLKCPVCSTTMEDIKNSTLYGWTVSTGKSCHVCGYWTGPKQRIPTRYVFTVEKERYIGEKMKGNDKR